MLARQPLPSPANHATTARRRGRASALAAVARFCAERAQRRATQVQRRQTKSTRQLPRRAAEAGSPALPPRPPTRSRAALRRRPRQQWRRGGGRGQPLDPAGGGAGLARPLPGARCSVSRALHRRGAGDGGRHEHQPANQQRAHQARQPAQRPGHEGEGGASAGARPRCRAYRRCRSPTTMPARRRSGGRPCGEPWRRRGAGAVAAGLLSAAWSHGGEPGRQAGRPSVT